MLNNLLPPAPPRRSRVALPRGAVECLATLARAIKPRDRLTVSEWADKYRWLSSKQSGEQGRWSTARNPVLREIMDSLSVQSPVREVVVIKSSQVGVTEATVNWLGYTLDHAPSPSMVLMPTLESRDTWKLQKLNPLIMETERVRAILGGRRSRDSANRQDAIDFPGGILFLAGGNSPNSYAQKSVRNLVLDDLDRFPSEVGEEGDPVALARGRLKAFERSKLLLISTPTVKGGSLIEREYEQSDQREYHVPCPACGEAQALKWSNLRWAEQVTGVWYECEHCGHHIKEHQKPRMLAAGNWIPRRPGVKRRGYHISALYAPIGLGPSWQDLALEWREAQGDQALLKTFINTNLGEPWEDQTTSLKPHELAKRAEAVPPRTIPVGCLALTVGVDTQDDWLAIKVLGWGAHHAWVIEYHELQGDTSRPEIWNELEAYLHTWPVNAFGHTLRYRAAGIDSRGHRSEQVRQFVSRTSLRLPCFAIQGATNRMNRPIAAQPSHIDKGRRGRVLRGGYGVWNVGTEHCKDFIFSRLASDTGHAPDDRYFRFCQDLPDTYYDGLLSEYFDPEKRRYVQKKGARWKRNEPLDTLTYAWAIGHHREVNLGRLRSGRVDPHYWNRLEKILESEKPDRKEPAEPEAQHEQETTTPPPTTSTRRKRTGKRKVWDNF
jgi:phage terminase large subunit GpA-like protein